MISPRAVPTHARSSHDGSGEPATGATTLVVISYYDARPLNDLSRILRSIEEHDAGMPFDVCIVVNQATGRPVTLPAASFPTKVLSRSNEGMNIGAWDHGWRENPGYTHYVFLQDECVIRRNGWLLALTERLSEPGMGMIGECINHRWSRAWDELTAGNEDDPAEVQVGTSRRARLCIALLEKRQIPPGPTGRHLRSLIWATSSEVLLKLDGFPIGQDYDECIAAEIAVSRHVESFGLSIGQAHRTPFYFVGHTQWVNTYPGRSASLSYVEWTRNQFSRPSFPFISLLGKGDATAKLDQLVKRVETERGLFESGVLKPPKCGYIALLVVLVDRVVGDGDVAPTVLSWCLQSAPHADLVFVATTQFLLDRTKAILDHSDFDEFSQIRLCLLSEWSANEAANYEFVLFARPGDQFHPSVASTLALLNESEQPDIVVWNERRHKPPDHGAWLFRQPKFEPFTIQSVAHIGMAFAVRSAWLSQFPYDFVEDVLHNDSHLFHVWLGQNPKARWTTHPEFFSSRQLAPLNSHELSRFGHDAYRSRYKEILSTVSEFQFLPSANSSQSPLAPVRRPQSVSVVVSFRDRPAETIACLRSLTGQRLDGQLEVILINNRSSEESLAEVKQSVELLRHDRVHVQIVDYDDPFNHSRQTNLGADVASGEVLVFLNNDAELLSEDVLDEMGAWALLPNVGTVGCQMLDSRSQLLCAGIQAREVIPSVHASPVDESKDTAYCGLTREVLANTFACSAIARSKYDKIGPLNEIEFPNGYNDVEYGLRIRQEGYRNVYLGHVQVRHTPGTSRGRCDESFQKILLRQRYPEIASDGMFRLSYEWRAEESRARPGHEPLSEELVNSNHPVPSLPPTGIHPALDQPVGLKQAVRVFYKATIYWVQRRILHTC